MCFEYGIAAALNQENLEKDPEIIEKIRPFLDQYDQKEINFSAGSKGLKKFEANNRSIVPNVPILQVNKDGPTKTRQAYI